MQQSFNYQLGEKMELSGSQKEFTLEISQSKKFVQAVRTIPRQWQWRLFSLGLIISDFLMVGLGFRVAYFFRFELSIDIFRLDVIPNIDFYQTMVFILIPVWLLIFALMGLYNRQYLLGGTQEYSLVFNATTAGMIILMAAGFLYPTFIFARGWLVLAWAFAVFFTIFARFIVRRIIYFLRKQGYFVSLAVIVGANNEGISLAEQLMRWNTSGLHIVGFVDKKLPAGTTVHQNLKVLGPVEKISEIINQFHIEEMILASSAISSRDSMVDLFMQYGVNSGVTVRMSSGLYEIMTTGLTVKEFAYVPLVGINPVRLRGGDRLLKTILDYSIAIPGVILCSPILLVIAIAIKLGSPGPIIHRRQVMGVNGKKFHAFKFRTMYENGNEILEKYPMLKKELAENHKLKDDPRITKVGSYLRKWSLDELPQLFNVLRGEMSIVGPRMISPEEMEKYSKWELNLLTVRPGITGLWQVNGRSDVSYGERVRLDMYYIRNWSIWFDIQILIQTVPAVLKRRGAY
jgi:exopolysaccharide biosynthesis polyprenyl glycosylphosphotransferase